VLSVGASKLTAAGAAPAVATAAGVHDAVVVAAVLSLLAILVALGMRTPRSVQEPAPHR
jgi:hypothetical protein